MGLSTYERKIARHLGEKIRELRLAKRNTQEELADRLEMTGSAISQVESGKALLGMRRFLKLCKIYETNPNVLLGYSTPKRYERRK